ncbi:MAG: hypothetical protein U0T84_07660 [Chitinophagales bacterium]
MKRFVILLGNIFLFVIHAYTQTVPNGSFEHWVTLDSINTPIGWTVSQELNCNPESSKQVIDKADSSYALKLESSTCQLAGGVHEGYAIAEFPVNSLPKYFTGAFKSARLGNDSAVISVFFYNNSTLVGSKIVTIGYSTDLSSYSYFSWEIDILSTLTPNKAAIYIFSDRPGFATLGNRLWIDQLAFDNAPLGLGIRAMEGTDKLTILPNPVTKQFEVIAPAWSIGHHAQLLDVSSRVINTYDNIAERYKIAIDGLAPGVYLFGLVDFPYLSQKVVVY